PTEFDEPRDTPCVCRDCRKRVGGEGTNRAIAARPRQELLSKQWDERSGDLRAPEERSLLPVKQSPEQSGIAAQRVDEAMKTMGAPGGPRAERTVGGVLAQGENAGQGRCA